MNVLAEDFWSSCLLRFSEEISAQQYNTWIKPLVCASDNDLIIIFAPNQFTLQFVKDRFHGKIEQYALEYFGKNISIELKVSSQSKKAFDLNHSASINDTTAPAISPTEKGESFRKITAANEVTRLNPAFTFETLISGKANQLARAAAMQIAENPGQAYNPLFVYGSTGLGKTHMIQAIGNAVQHHQPKAKIRYIQAERYVNDMVRAYRHKAFDEFKQYYQSLDILLIDDIQFFSGKKGTQEEFFYAYNALIDAHRQVVITSDRYPKEIEGIDDRLISRFGWGLTVAIEPPELEMRVAILQSKAESDGFALDGNIAFFIAKHVRANVRELEGALKKVLAYSRFTGEQVTLELTKDALKDILAAGNKLITVENIQKTVADFYKIKVADMHSKKRTRDIARPRQIAMAIAKDLTQMSLPAIGDAFGGRDHTTVLHACRTIAQMKQTDSTMNHDYNVLCQILRN